MKWNEICTAIDGERPIERLYVLVHVAKDHIHFSTIIAMNVNGFDRVLHYFAFLLVILEINDITVLISNKNDI